MEYAKAFASALAAALASVGTALADGVVSPTEWVAAALAALAALGFVAVVPNKPRDTFSA